MLKSVIDKHSDKICQAKERLRAVLKMILGGDQVAADYTLMSLLSYISCRESGMLLGNICVNLTNMTPKRAENLSRLI